MLHKYNFILLFVIFLFTVELHAAAAELHVASMAGYEYVAEADAWLRLHTVPAVWQDARLRCHLEGGALASPTTSAMAAAMTAMMAVHKSHTLTTRDAFIGVHAFISKGDFVSMEGVPLANLSLHWSDGEPNNANNNEDCVVMTETGKHNDVACASVHHYFCRKESAKMTLNNCGTTAPGYQWESRTSSCYKFHLVPRPWQRAAMACHAEGGHLVVINSETEHQVLKEIFAKISIASIKGAGPNMALVGFWDWKEHGEWLTVFGETLSEAGFEGWGPGEPNSLGGEEFCGAIKRDGLLSDVPCGMRLAFICEITPK